MNTQLKAACAAVTLVGVWGNAEADGVLSLDTNKPLEDVSGFYYYNSSVYPDDDSTRFVREFEYNDLAATIGVSGPHRLDVVEDRGEPINYRFGYTLMGVYDAPRSYVSVLLDKDVAANAIANNLSWDEVFLPSNSAYVSESQAASYLASFFPEYGRFLDGYANLFPAWNEEATLVHFSDATYGGTGNASPVPEPTSLIALGAGGLALFRRRRKACA